MDPLKDCGWWISGEPRRFHREARSWKSLAIATRLADTRMFKVPVSSGGRLLGVEVWRWCLLLRQVAEGMGLSLECPRTSVGHFGLNVLP